MVNLVPHGHFQFFVYPSASERLDLIITGCRKSPQEGHLTDTMKSMIDLDQQ